MNKLFHLLSVIMITVMAACNSSDSHHDHASGKPKTKADSLYQEVIDGHDIAMSAQMTKMDKAKQGIQSLIDSVSKLPAKAKEAAVPLKEKLDSVLQKLNQAGDAMNTWMEEFKYDSAKNNAEERIKYLTSEKLKVENVKEAILNSLEKADSLLKKKF